MGFYCYREGSTLLVFVEVSDGLQGFPRFNGNKLWMTIFLYRFILTDKYMLFVLEV